MELTRTGKLRHYLIKSEYSPISVKYYILKKEIMNCISERNKYNLLGFSLSNDNIENEFFILCNPIIFDYRALITRIVNFPIYAPKMIFEEYSYKKYTLPFNLFNEFVYNKRNVDMTINLDELYNSICDYLIENDIVSF